MSKKKNPKEEKETGGKRSGKRSQPKKSPPNKKKMLSTNNKDESDILQVLISPGKDVGGIAIASDEASAQTAKDADEAKRVEEMPYFKCTDYGNAERMVYWHGENIRYCSDWGGGKDSKKGWLVWTGKRWLLDKIGQIMQCAKHTARTIPLEVKRCEDPKMAKAIAKHASQTEGRAGLNNMIYLCQDERPITTDKMDVDPWILNCKTGMIDLQTGRIMAHDRRAYCTKIARCEYIPQAECPRWLQFLREIFCNDGEVVDWVQKAVGYSMTGLTDEQCFFVLYGHGANGKSTFLKILQRILGSYATTAEMRTFVSDNKRSGPRDDLAHLHGARFVTASEAEKGSKLAESFIKEVTGGERVTARHLFGNLFEFFPIFKLWLGTNHMPRISGTDHGIWRRVRFIPFEATFLPEQQDKRLDLTLVNEMPGILQWAIQGCLRWQKESLHPIPSAVENATGRMREQMDVLADFLRDECVVTDPHLSITSGDLHKRYVLWAEEQGVHRPMSNKRLSDELEARGFQKGRATSGPDKDRMVWQSFGLKSRI